MRLSGIFFFVAVLLAFTACQTSKASLRSHVGALNIVSVDLTANQVSATHPAAARYLKDYTRFRLHHNSDPGGRPINVQIEMNALLYKDPLLSVLVGSANTLAATVSITDTDGRMLMRRQLSVTSNAAINGVVGAVIAATDNHNKITQELVVGLAGRIEKMLFGKVGNHR